MEETPENVTLNVQSLKHKLVQDKVEVTIDQLTEALQKAYDVIVFAEKELDLWKNVIRTTRQRCDRIETEIAKKEKENGKISS